MMHADISQLEVNMKISKRGQITIPKDIREEYGLREDVEIEIKPTDEGLIIQKRTEGRQLVDSVRCTLSDHLGPDFDVDEYIEEIQGR